MTEPSTLSELEIQQLTGYMAPLRQLDALHKLGFIRAYRARNGNIVLSREHFKAVERGEFMREASQQKASIDLGFLHR